MNEGCTNVIELLEPLRKVRVVGELARDLEEERLQRPVHVPLPVAPLRRPNHLLLLETVRGVDEVVQQRRERDGQDQPHLRTSVSKLPDIRVSKLPDIRAG